MPEAGRMVFAGWSRPEEDGETGRLAGLLSFTGLRSPHSLGREIQIHHTLVPSSSSMLPFKTGFSISRLRMSKDEFELPFFNPGVLLSVLCILLWNLCLDELHKLLGHLLIAFVQLIMIFRTVVKSGQGQTFRFVVCLSCFTGASSRSTAAFGMRCKGCILCPRLPGQSKEGRASKRSFL